MGQASKQKGNAENLNLSVNYETLVFLMLVAHSSTAGLNRAPISLAYPNSISNAKDLKDCLFTMPTTKR